MAHNLIRVFFTIVNKAAERAAIAGYQLYRLVKSIGQCQHIAHIYAALINI